MPSFVATSTATTTTALPSSSATTSLSLSFHDPRTVVPTVLELHVKSQLRGGKQVAVCRATECARAITDADKLVVRTHANYTYYDPKLKKEVSKYGPRFIHFTEACLKDYDTHILNNYYAPHKSFDYGRIVLDGKSKTKLTQVDLQFLQGLGVKTDDN